MENSMIDRISRLWSWDTAISRLSILASWRGHLLHRSCWAAAILCEHSGKWKHRCRETAVHSAFLKGDVWKHVQQGTEAALSWVWVKALLNSMSNTDLKEMFEISGAALKWAESQTHKVCFSRKVILQLLKLKCYWMLLSLDYIYLYMRISDIHFL